MRLNKSSNGIGSVKVDSARKLLRSHRVAKVAVPEAPNVLGFETTTMHYPRGAVTVDRRWVDDLTGHDFWSICPLVGTDVYTDKPCLTMQTTLLELLAH